MAIPKVCSIPDCGKRHKGYGWCGKHYQRWLRYGDPLGGRTQVGEPERYLREVVMAYEGDECLIWPYARSANGGQIRREGRIQYVARLVCEAVKGPPPTPNHETAHSCGKGDEACVTKRHLSWKTHIDNESDKLEHGTRTRGEKTPSSKLTEADVREIRTLHGSVTQSSLAARFGVDQSQISNIQHRKHWAWLG